MEFHLNSSFFFFFNEVEVRKRNSGDTCKYLQGIKASVGNMLIPVVPEMHGCDL